MLGDAYCAAIVEALSKDDLARMDKEKELLEAEEGIGEGQSLIDNMEKGSKESGKVHIQQKINVEVPFGDGAVQRPG